MPSIASRVADVRAHIAAACSRAGRAAATVRLIAVTKSQGPQVLPELLAAGVADWGENRIEHQAAMQVAAPPGGRFHAIGRIQGRQISRLVPLSVCLHSLCEHDHVDRLERACLAGGHGPQQRFPVFIQVKTSGEAAKAGVDAEALPRLLDQLRACTAVEAVGLMTMAPELGVHADADAVRRCFAACRALAGRHGLARLSMGMSGDYGIAVEEGATDVRVGTALFTEPPA